jgi:hypothetical protein
MHIKRLAQQRLILLLLSLAYGCAWRKLLTRYMR